MKKFKYVIVTPRVNNGGPIVLHNLCKLLNELGEDARVFYPGRYHLYKDNKIKYWINYLLYVIRDVAVNPILKFISHNNSKEKFYVQTKCKRKFFPFVAKNTIVIYPEVIFGNPLHGKKVVRWLLYHNSQYQTQENKTIGYEKNDLFFSYRDIFNDETLNPERRLCYTPYIDLALYKRTNFGKRRGKCYILRKGEWRVKPEDCSDGIIMDNLSESEKVRIFNECEYCISYDTQTTYSQIAALCGCISIVIPEEGKTREDYRKDGDNSFGEAFGFSEQEIEYAIKTAPLVYNQFEKLNNKSKNEVKKFIIECENYFN